MIYIYFIVNFFNIIKFMIETVSSFQEVGMNNKRIRNTIILCFMCIALVLSCTMIFVNMFSEELTESARVSLEDLADQQQLAINRQLSGMIYNLVSAAETISLISNNEMDVLDFLYSKKEPLGFEVAIISDLSGKAFVSTGEYIDINEYDYFKVAVGGETFATETYTSKITNQEVVTVSAPIVIDGKIEGVLALQYSTGYLSSLLASLTDQSGSNYILNSEGKIIVSSDGVVEDQQQFVDAKFKEGKTIEAVVDDFKNKVSSSAAYSIDDGDFFGAYRSIIINDWVLFFEVSEEFLTESITRLERTMAIISVVIISFGAFTVLYIVITKNRYSAKLEKIAYYDELTGGPNIQKLKLHMEEFLNNRPADDYGIIKFDVANFKAINEIYGFEVGNRVLCAISNTGGTIKDKYFLQARTGVDEFIFFSKGRHIYKLQDNKDNFQVLFKTLVPELCDHNFFFRYGRYYIKRGETDVNDIISKVNMAHSTAKKTASRDVCDYDEKYIKRALKDAEIANKMHKALENGEFKMYLQPKVEIKTNKIKGAEALVRWVELSGNIVYPDEFIPVFEQNGFIIELDKLMLRSACVQIRKWIEQGREVIPISVNFSRLHLHNLNLVEELTEMVASYQVAPKYIEIELTETIVSDNEDDSKQILKRLQDAGFLVSIDDFGSGYSSLGMLKNFEVNTLKLDKSFFDEGENQGEHEKAGLVVGSIVDLSTRLGMYTVAEGIETQSQIDFLKKINCSAVQGYFFSKPLPTDEFDRFCNNLKKREIQ